MAKQMIPFHRTQGDGMEKVDNEEAKTEHLVVLQPQKTVDLKLPEAVPQKNLYSKPTIKQLGLAIKLTPKAVDKRKKNLFANLKNKEPKFVPYEPYKAAVNPIVPPIKKKTFQQGSKKKPKDIEPGISTEQKAEAISQSAKNVIDSSICREPEVLEEDWKKKTKTLELEIQNLKEENEQLENQLKFQVQVNGELKNLLVAAVGEDIETKVHVLTEDKLHLAHALLKSSESLTSNQERMEWLAGQCEVWRSKFLASSVMLEELARWKASLCQKVNEAHDALRKFLDEQRRIRDCVLKTHKNLSRLRDNFDLRNKKNKLTHSNVIEICEENLKLSDGLLLELLGSEKMSDTGPLTCIVKTPAEKSAEHILSNPNLMQLVGQPDAACNAVVGAAVTLSGQLYLQSHPPEIECCPQCKGEIKLV